MSPWWRSLQVNRNMRIGFLLGALQFIIYMSGYDHLIRLGPFVAHHFVELPAFFFIGMGFSEFLYDTGWSSRFSQVTNLALFVLNILVTSIGRGFDGVIAGFIVSFPYLIGFYYHRIMTRAPASAVTP